MDYIKDVSELFREYDAHTIYQNLKCVHSVIRNDVADELVVQGFTIDLKKRSECHVWQIFYYLPDHWPKIRLSHLEDQIKDQLHKYPLSALEVLSLCDFETYIDWLLHGVSINARPLIKGILQKQMTRAYKADHNHFVSCLKRLRLKKDKTRFIRTIVTMLMDNFSQNPEVTVCVVNVIKQWGLMDFARKVIASRLLDSHCNWSNDADGSVRTLLGFETELQKPIYEWDKRELLQKNIEQSELEEAHYRALELLRSPIRQHNMDYQDYCKFCDKYQIPSSLGAAALVAESDQFFTDEEINRSIKRLGQSAYQRLLLKTTGCVDLEQAAEKIVVKYLSSGEWPCKGCFNLKLMLLMKSLSTEALKEQLTGKYSALLGAHLTNDFEYFKPFATAPKTKKAMVKMMIGDAV